jgi:predicted RNA polymerase sigma factor
LKNNISKIHNTRAFLTKIKIFNPLNRSKNHKKAPQKYLRYFRNLTIISVLQAHCHRSLGDLYRQGGQLEQARAAWSRAIEMYRDMEMTFWLPQAEAALEQQDETTS